MSQQEIWNEIAGSWTHLRSWPQKEVIDFAFGIAKPEYVKELGLRKKILDVGCGNCRNLIPFKQHELHGIDFSEEMIKQAEKFCEKHELTVDLKQSSATQMSFDDNEFDVVLCLAALHCLKKDERKKAVEEIARVLKPSGIAFVSVWNRWQKKYFFRLLLNPDVYMPWNKSGEQLQRYYHFFTYGELTGLLSKHLDVIKSYPEKDYKGFKLFSKNIFVVARKARVPKSGQRG